jgi:predicted heme/steroid binding protein
MSASSLGHVSKAKHDAGAGDLASAPRRFTRAKLATYNGKAPGRRMLIAYKGKVYDVTRSYPWAGGVHWARVHAGQDLTGKLDESVHGEEMLKRVPCVGVLLD